MGIVSSASEISKVGTKAGEKFGLYYLKGITKVSNEAKKCRIIGKGWGSKLLGVIQLHIIISNSPHTVQLIKSVGVLQVYKSMIEEHQFCKYSRPSN